MKAVMKTRKIKNGDVFTRLTIIEAYSKKIGKKWKHYAACDCGTARLFDGANLAGGGSRSCGCLKIDLATTRFTHGATNTTEHNIWKGMRQRCSNAKKQNFKHYGGRGIKICAEWDNFENFLRDMGPRPNNSMSLDRIDNNKGYEPNNCRWVTQSQQVLNQGLRHSNRTGIKGVKSINRHWESYITNNYKKIYLGYFDNLLDAACARISAENKYHRPRML